MTELTVKFEIPPALVKALGTDLQKQVIQPAAYAWAAAVKKVMVVYPAATEANSSIMPRWYQRGYGPRWRRKDGSVGGRKTSQTMNRSWALEREPWGALAGNRATYSHWVHSSTQQARAHKAHGWKTDETAEREAKPTFDGIMNQLMKRWGLA